MRNKHRAEHEEAIVTDWDERERQIRRQLDAQQEEAIARQRAAAADAEERWRKLNDAVTWAVKRYQSAGIAPTPIYSAWDEEIKPLFRQARTERRETKVAEAYPLIVYSTRETYSRTVAIMIATGGEIFGVSATHSTSIKIRENPGDPGSVVAACYVGGKHVYQPFDKLVWFLTPSYSDFSEWDSSHGVDEACDAIVHYVMRYVDYHSGDF